MKDTTPWRSRKTLLLFRKAIEPLWVCGLCLMLVLSGTLLWRSPWIGLKEEPYEWVQFLTLGTIFPGLILGISLLHNSHRTRKIAEALQGILAFFCFLFLIILAITKLYTIFFIVAAIQFVATTHFFRKDPLLKNTNKTNSVVTGCIAFFVIAASWLAGLRLVFWEWSDNWAFGSYHSIAAFIISWVLVLTVLFRDDKPISFQKISAVKWCFNGIALVIIGLASVRTDSLFTNLDFIPGNLPAAFHHWGVYIGPAQMVREGGWLLWDVPAQYGFLCTLTIAAMPFQSLWQSVYVLNASLIFITTVFLFFLLQSLQRGLLGQIFGLGVALSVVHFVTAYPDHCAGLQIFPSSGPLRFIWCYVLLSILLWGFLYAHSSTRRKGVLIAGSCCWVVGSLWSPESAAYSACIWLPSYAILTWQFTACNVHDFRRRFWSFVSWCLLPIGLMFFALATILAVYHAKLGHGPDWLSFVEYALFTRPDAFGWAVDPESAVWMLLLLFCCLATSVAYFITHPRPTKKRMLCTGLPLIVASCAIVWSVSSYFIPRSTDYNLINLSAVYVTAISMILLVIKQVAGDDRWVFTIKSGLVPILTIYLAAPFMDTIKFSQTLSSWKQGYTSNIETKLPKMDEPMRELLRSSEVKPSDALIFVNSNLLPAPQFGRYTSLPSAWQPTVPFALLGPLREARQQLYMQRFTQRVQRGGWLLQYKDDRSHWYPWFAEQVFRTHQPTKVYENQEYRLVWFELRRQESNSLSAR